MLRSVPSAIRDFISSSFPELKGADNEPVPMERIGQVRGLLRLLDNLDPALMPRGGAYGTFLTACETIRSKVIEWESHVATEALRRVPGVSGENPVWIIKSLLESCLDEAPKESTRDLPFVEDVAYKQRLRADLAAAELALENSEFKAATVLAGSLIEAILLAEIEQCSPNSLTTAIQKRQLERLKRRAKTFQQVGGQSVKKALQYAELGELVEIADELKIFPRAETLDAVRLAQEYRNLIHPGKQIREGAVCDQGTAHSALGALHSLIRECENLWRKRSGPP